MDIDFEMDNYYITARIKETLDGYGTGDSPTLYEVQIKRIMDEDGDAVRESDLGDSFINDIEDEAIRVYRG